MIPPCVGIIVFNENKTVLVRTEVGNYSFPKGGRKKGETDLQTAWRELYEETGLSNENVKLIDDLYIDELSDKGHLSVRYFIGIIVKNIIKLKYDPEELEFVGWFDIKEALQLDKLKSQRKDILQKASEHYNNYLTS